MMSAHSTSVMLRVGMRLIFPAQLTRISILERRCREASSNSSSEERLHTSEQTRKVLRPRFSSSTAVSSTCSRRREEAMTSAPASARPKLSVRPMPEVPPITTAVLPSRLRIFLVIAFPLHQEQATFTEPGKNLADGLLRRSADDYSPGVGRHLKRRQLAIEQVGIHIR